MKGRIGFPREVLLVEIERWCADPACNAHTRISLTKDEARSYTGFTCERCEREFSDALTERDIPDWWEELKITSLEGVRMEERAAERSGEQGGTVARLSEAWGRLQEDEDAETESRGAEGRS